MAVALPIIEKHKKQKQIGKTKIFWSIAIVILFLIIAVLFVLLQKPTPKLITKTIDGKVAIDSELIIDFNWPVSRRVEVAITPDIFGRIFFDKYIYQDQLAREIIFTPELTWLPGATYQVTISNIKSATPSLRPAEDVIIVFTVEDQPVIKSVLPEPAEEIRPDISWQVALDKSNNRLAVYDFKFEPDIEASVTLSEDKKLYTITPKNLLSQGQEYQLDINKKDIRYYFGTEEIGYQAEPESVYQGAWQVRQAPGIVSFSPQGDNILLDQPITIQFDENIDFESFKQSVAIEPVLDGSWSTEDYQTVSFTPKQLAQDTNYSVTIKSGLKTFKGGYIPEDSTYSFTTIGPVQISSSSPSNGSQGNSVYSSIRLTLDQAVVHDSAESKFSISPAIDGSFTWDGNTMIYQPTTTLDFNSTYTVTVAAGVVSQQGFDSVVDQAISFSTELSVTNLSVQFHRQEHNLSCEIATLVMALSYYGDDVSEATIIEAIGVDPTPKANGIWGNPHIAFVGDIDGHQPSTGYGVYWQPIATAAQAYRPASWFTGWSLADLTAEIKKGHPVIVWGTAGSGSRIDWKTPEGGNVVAVNGEHTRLVTGFIGPADNPTKIITLDPLSGEKYFTKDSFLLNWGVLNNSGVVVE